VLLAIAALPVATGASGATWSRGEQPPAAGAGGWSPAPAGAALARGLRAVPADRPVRSPRLTAAATRTGRWRTSLPPFPPVGGDPVRDEQWQLSALGAPAAWRESTGAGVVVAVLDSGVDAAHPDLTGQVLAGIDLVTGNGDGRTDPVGHGTTVASFIAGRADDSDGVVGLAPSAKILPVRVLDETNRYGNALVVARGVQWAVDHGARVINLSLGGGSYSPALADALDYAFARDVVVVACTGNRLPEEPADVWYPAREPGVVAVAGLDRPPEAADPLWAGSLTGPATVLTAPASNLLGAEPGGSYWHVQGTSFAAPLVSATAALIRARWPKMSAANVVERLTQTARDLGPAGRDERFGFGMVDPVRALAQPVPEVASNPLDTAPPPGVSGFGPSQPAAGPRGVEDEPPAPLPPGSRLAAI
jgi:type VII secretion-associated serine protease mycosin